MINILSLVDNIKEEFTNTIPTQDLLLSLLIALISSLIINFIYKKTYMGVSYSKSNPLSIILLTLVTCIVIRTINSNLSLSLGMVGALSIVRFRTSVKDPIDTIYMFWAITAGIMSGAGLYLVTILSNLIIALLYFMSFLIESKKDNKKLLIITLPSSNSKEIIDMLQKKKCVLKTESYKENNESELTFEAKNRTQIEDIISLKEDKNIKTINIIDIS